MDTCNITFAGVGWDCWEEQQGWIPSSLPHHQVSQRDSTFAMVPGNGSTDGNGRLSAFQCYIHWTLLYICQCLGSQDLYYIQHLVYCLYNPPDSYCFHYCRTDILPTCCWGPWMVVEVSTHCYLFVLMFCLLKEYSELIRQVLDWFDLASVLILELISIVLYFTNHPWLLIWSFFSLVMEVSFFWGGLGVFHINRWLFFSLTIYKVFGNTS